MLDILEDPSKHQLRRIEPPPSDQQAAEDARGKTAK
jgi:hypothetical protein